MKFSKVQIEQKGLITPMSLYPFQHPPVSVKSGNTTRCPKKAPVVRFQRLPDWWSFYRVSGASSYYQSSQLPYPSYPVFFITLSVKGRKDPYGREAGA